MTTRASEREPEIEAGPRRALQWGAGLMVLGLGLVGVARPDEGAVIAVAGVAITVFGIHRFGRLGPVDRELEAREEASGAAARVTGSDTLWMSGLAVAAGAALLASTYFTRDPSGNRALLAVGMIIAGALRALVARGNRQRRERIAARAEKRAEAADGPHETPPKRPRRARRKGE